MTKGRKGKPSLKAVSSVARVSVSGESKVHDSMDSDDSLFDEDIERVTEDHDETESVFENKEGEDVTGDEDGAPKDTESRDVKDGKESGEKSGKEARVLTIDEIRK